MEERGFRGGEIEAETCCALLLKETQSEERRRPWLLPRLPDLWGGDVPANTVLFTRVVEHVGLWPPARAPASEQRTDKQKTWLAGAKPLLDFISNKLLFINPRTAHLSWGEQSNRAEREKQLEIQLLL